MAELKDESKRDTVGLIVGGTLGLFGAALIDACGTAPGPGPARTATPAGTRTSSNSAGYVAFIRSQPQGHDRIVIVLTAPNLGVGTTPPTSPNVPLLCQGLRLLFQDTATGVNGAVFAGLVTAQGSGTSYLAYTDGDMNRTCLPSVACA